MRTKARLFMLGAWNARNLRFNRRWDVLLRAAGLLTDLRQVGTRCQLSLLLLNHEVYRSSACRYGRGFSTDLWAGCGIRHLRCNLIRGRSDEVAWLVEIVCCWRKLVVIFLAVAVGYKDFFIGGAGWLGCWGFLDSVHFVGD